MTRSPFRALRRNALALAALGAAVLVPAALAGRPARHVDPDHGWAEDTVFTLSTIAPGVVQAVGRQGRLVGSNSAFIVTDRDVILVDDHITPRAARALVAEIARVTDKPLRWVINTHYHYDHVSGNGIFGPDVEIVAHPATRERLRTHGAQMFRDQVAAVEQRLPAMRARRDTTRDAAARAALDQQIVEWQGLLEDYRALTLALPTMTVDSALVLYRGGGQEIRVFWLGRGHTGGDVVVQLPRENVVIAGDLITNTAGTPNMMDGYPSEWAATLRRLRPLVGPATITLSGHGDPFTGPDRYEATARLFDDIWDQTRRLVAEGVGRDELARRLDLTRHTGPFPGLRNGLNPVFARRAWDLASGRAEFP